MSIRPDTLKRKQQYEEKKAAKKIRYWERRRANLCYRCGAKIEEGRTSGECQRCFDRVSARSASPNYRVKTQRKASIALGGCRYHPDRDAIAGTQLCGFCAERKSEYDTRRRKKAVQKAEQLGLCNDCFKAKRDPGYTSCQECRDKRRNRWLRCKADKELAEKGLKILRRKK